MIIVIERLLQDPQRGNGSLGNGTITAGIVAVNREVNEVDGVW